VKEPGKAGCAKPVDWRCYSGEESDCRVWVDVWRFNESGVSFLLWSVLGSCRIGGGKLKGRVTTRLGSFMMQRSEGQPPTKSNRNSGNSGEDKKIDVVVVRLGR